MLRDHAELSEATSVFLESAGRHDFVPPRLVRVVVEELPWMTPSGRILTQLRVN